MKRSMFQLIVSGMIITFWGQCMAACQASAETGRFVQDRFAIGFWVDPPSGAEADFRYKEIADANFTMVIGGFGARTPETVKKQIELCEKYNLKAVVSRAGLPPDKLSESPAVWGYMVHDEPKAKDFPKLRKTVEGIRAARPGRLSSMATKHRWIL